MIKPVLSIVIATYNSASTLDLVLKSISSQTLSRRKYEVIVSDGGSKDGTLKIAKKYFCRIVNNPRTEQNYGKYLGFIQSKGKYVFFLDSDEQLLNPNCLKHRLSVFSTNKRVKMLVGSGYVTPAGFNYITRYINEFGDPFSYFIYHLSKNSQYFISDMKTSYKIIVDLRTFLVFDLYDTYTNTIFELTAGGSMFDKQFLIQNFPKIKENYSLLNHAFYLIASKSPYLAITKDDPVAHYSSTSLSKYLKKIEWRVTNNVYGTNNIDKTVFLGREAIVKNANIIKKYLFIPYALSFVFPLIDSLRLSITRKQVGYLIHLPLSLYAAILIITHIALKSLGFTPDFKSYGSNESIKITT